MGHTISIDYSYLVLLDRREYSGTLLIEIRFIIDVRNDHEILEIVFENVREK
jgi:hypothetical protein